MPPETQLDITLDNLSHIPARFVFNPQRSPINPILSPLCQKSVRLFLQVVTNKLHQKITYDQTNPSDKLEKLFLEALRQGSHVVSTENKGPLIAVVRFAIRSVSLALSTMSKLCRKLHMPQNIWRRSQIFLDWGMANLKGISKDVYTEDSNSVSYETIAQISYEEWLIRNGASDDVIESILVTFLRSKAFSEFRCSPSESEPAAGGTLMSLFEILKHQGVYQWLFSEQANSHRAGSLRPPEGELFLSSQTVDGTSRPKAP